MPEPSRPSGPPHVPATSQVEPPPRAPEEVVFHRRHAIAALWQILVGVVLLGLGATGGYILRSAQPNKTVDLIGKNTLEADTLPSTASRNAARIFSFTQGLGLLVVQEGRPFTYTIDSQDATACQLVSPARSGTATNTSMTIDPGHPWYPRPGRPVMFRAFCTDGERIVGDSAVVVLGTVRGLP